MNDLTELLKAGSCLLLIALRARNSQLRSHYQFVYIHVYTYMHLGLFHFKLVNEFHNFAHNKLHRLRVVLSKSLFFQKVVDNVSVFVK